MDEAHNLPVTPTAHAWLVRVPALPAASRLSAPIPQRRRRAQTPRRGVLVGGAPGWLRVMRGGNWRSAQACHHDPLSSRVCCMSATPTPDRQLDSWYHRGDTARRTHPHRPRPRRRRARRTRSLVGPCDAKIQESTVAPPHRRDGGPIRVSLSLGEARTARGAADQRRTLGGGGGGWAEGGGEKRRWGGCHRRVIVRARASRVERCDDPAALSPARRASAPRGGGVVRRACERRRGTMRRNGSSSDSRWWSSRAGTFSSLPSTTDRARLPSFPSGRAPDEPRRGTSEEEDVVSQ